MGCAASPSSTTRPDPNHDSSIASPGRVKTPARLGGLGGKLYVGRAFFLQPRFAKCRRARTTREGPAHRARPPRRGRLRARRPARRPGSRQTRAPAGPPPPARSHGCAAGQPPACVQCMRPRVTRCTTAEPQQHSPWHRTLRTWTARPCSPRRRSHRRSGRRRAPPLRGGQAGGQAARARELWCRCQQFSLANARSVGNTAGAQSGEEPARSAHQMSLAPSTWLGP
jgi:hypothetical protein